MKILEYHLNTLNYRETTLYLPKNAKFLNCLQKSSVLYIYFLCDIKNAKETRNFFVMQNDETLHGKIKYLDSEIIKKSDIAWHIFEKL